MRQEVQVYRVNTLARLLCFTSSIALFTSAFVLIKFGISDAPYEKIGFAGAPLLGAVFLWATIVTFVSKITLTNEMLEFQSHALFPQWRIRWDDINRIVIDSTAGPADAPTIRFYKLIPRQGRSRGIIGPWIKNYKQLLREILARVPPDCKIDPEVIEVSRFLESFEGRQRLSELRERGLVKPPPSRL